MAGELAPPGDTKTTMKTLLITLMSIIAFIGLLYGTAELMEGGIKTQEIYECNKWQGWAENYNDYYLLEWQNEQCKSHGIQINAPVR